MKEKPELRTCRICRERKRTTVRKAEQEKYLCNPCIRKIGYELWLQTLLASKTLAWKGMFWIIVAIGIGILIGKFVF